MNLLTLTEKGDGILVAGVLCVLLGASLLLWGRPGKDNWGLKFSLTIFVLILGGTAIAALCIDSTPGFWMPIAAVALIWGMGILLRSGFPEWLSHFLRVLLAHPAFRGALLMGLGLAVLVGWSTLQDQRHVLGQGNTARPKKDFEPMEAKMMYALTDRGLEIPLHANANPSNAATAHSEDDRANDPFWRGKLITVAQPDVRVNCHGWVFTAGKYWLDGSYIDSILKDNGYRKIEQPTPGDLIVYRSNRNTISHTGIVRFIAEDGRVFVESKWSWHSRFVHAAEDQMFSEHYEYYRSERNGHVLRFVDPNKTPATVPPHQPGTPYSDRKFTRPL